MYIYHLVLPGVWETWKDKTFYESASLAAEGFIHCSFEEQLEGVIERYYCDEEQLVILKIDTSKLTSKLIAEPSTNDELYPHVYGPINNDSIVETNIWRKDGNRAANRPAGDA